MLIELKSVSEILREFMIEIGDFDSTFDGFSGNWRVEGVLCQIFEHDAKSTVNSEKKFC